MKAAIVAGAGVLTILAGQAVAADDCLSFVGKAVETVDFDTVVAQVAKVPVVKSEFETSATYAARVAAVTAQVPKTFVIRYTLNAEGLRYNADVGKLRVSASAFRNRGTDYSAVFGYGSPFEDAVKPAFTNIDVVVGQTMAHAGEHTGANAYGATARVTEMVRKTEAVFERPGSHNEETFAGTSDADGHVGTLFMMVEDAKALKASGTAALVIAPKWPYFASGKKLWGATIQSPTEVTEEISVLVADITCALLLDGSGTAVGAYAIR